MEQPLRNFILATEMIKIEMIINLFLLLPFWLYLASSVLVKSHKIIIHRSGNLGVIQRGLSIHSQPLKKQHPEVLSHQPEATWALLQSLRRTGVFNLFCLLNFLGLCENYKLSEYFLKQNDTHKENQLH